MAPILLSSVTHCVYCKSRAGWVEEEERKKKYVNLNAIDPEIDHFTIRIHALSGITVGIYDGLYLGSA